MTGSAVPAGATGVLLNVAVVGPSADGFLSVCPGDATGAPSTSSLNFTAGDIVPNSVQVGLPTAGQIDITYDAFGQAGPTTDVLIDVVGYMAAGTGPRGFSAWDAISSGQTVTGSMIWNGPVMADGKGIRINVAFPGKATPAITGSISAPTAPPGKVCLYLFGSGRVVDVAGQHNFVNGSDGFWVFARTSGSPPSEMSLYFSWAYTAP